MSIVSWSFVGSLILPARSFLPSSESSQQSFSKYACSFVNDFDVMFFCLQVCCAITVWWQSFFFVIYFAIFFDASQLAVHRADFLSISFNALQETLATAAGDAALAVQDCGLGTAMGYVVWNGNEALFTYFHCRHQLKWWNSPYIHAQLPLRRKCGIRSSTCPGSRRPKNNTFTSWHVRHVKTNPPMSCHCHSSTMLHLWIWRRSFSRQTQMATVSGTKLSRSRCLNATSSYCFVRMNWQRSSRSKKWMMPAAIRSCSLLHLMCVCYVIQCAYRHVCVYRAGFKIR